MRKQKSSHSESLHDGAGGDQGKFLNDTAIEECLISIGNERQVHMKSIILHRLE